MGRRNNKDNNIPTTVTTLIWPEETTKQ